MIYGFYQSAAGMMTTEYRQGVIANNLANADNVGFKRDVPTFAERFTAAKAGQRTNPTNEMLEGLNGGTWLGRTHVDFSNGPLTKSSNPLDVAVEGPGFLMVDGGNGPLLTRDGRMMMDSSGRLVSVADGAAMLSNGGAPIVLNRNGGTPSIDETGRISQRGVSVGQLGLVDVDDYRGLTKVGNGRFGMAEGVTKIPFAALVHSGYTENSGVEPVKSLVDMIESSRAYQMNAQMISLQDQTLGKLINEVAKV